MSTAVAMVPTRTSGNALEMRSSTILGKAMVSTLNVSPALRAITIKSPNNSTASRGVSGTAGLDSRVLAWWRSSGVTQR
jgi:hypothetical protein